MSSLRRAILRRPPSSFPTLDTERKESNVLGRDDTENQQKKGTQDSAVKTDMSLTHDKLHTPAPDLPEKQGAGGGTSFNAEHARNVPSMLEEGGFQHEQPAQPPRFGGRQGVSLSTHMRAEQGENLDGAEQEKGVGTKTCAQGRPRFPSSQGRVGQSRSSSPARVSSVAHSIPEGSSVAHNEHSRPSPLAQGGALSEKQEKGPVGCFARAWGLVLPEGGEQGERLGAPVACPRCFWGESLWHMRTGAFLCEHCGFQGDTRTAPTAYRREQHLLPPVWWEKGIRLDEGSEEGVEGKDMTGVGTLGHEALTILRDACHHTGLDVETLARFGIRAGLIGQPPSSLASTEEGHAALQKGQPLPRVPALLFPCTRDGVTILDVVAVPWHSEQEPAAWGTPRRLPGSMGTPYGLEALGSAEEPVETVVWVDHPFDVCALRAHEGKAIALPEALNPYRPDGGDWSAMARLEHDLAPLKRMVLAVRDSEAGHRLEEEVARRFGRERCLRVRWRTWAPDLVHASAWALWTQGRGETLLPALEAADPFPVIGIHELHDVDERFEALYEYGLQPGLSTGWPTMDTYYTVKPGEWTLITGIPGHGKSNYIDALMIHLARLHEWVFGVFSPENQPIERHYAGLMEKLMDKPFSEGRTARVTPEEKNWAKGWLNRHVKMILPDEERGNWSIEGVLDLARSLVFRYGIRGLVIDPWNELDHSRPAGLSEHEYLSKSLTRIRRFARMYGVHVWVVAHPRLIEPKADGEYPVPTPYMVSGGAHWRNKADNCLTIYRFVGKEDEDIIDVHSQKIRFKENGRVGRCSLRCDWVTGVYRDDVDQVGRAMALKNGWHKSSKEVRGTERCQLRGATPPWIEQVQHTHEGTQGEGGSFDDDPYPM